MAVSKHLATKYNNIVDYVSHMINFPICTENLRSVLNIPTDGIVFGRYGGPKQFDIEFVHSAIRRILEIDNNIYFLSANINVFYRHPRIIYLNCIVNLNEKIKFINTCDAMIHTRSDGEMFGLSVGEFSSLGKPIITTDSGDTAHIDMLGTKAIIYKNKEQLIEIFKNIKQIINTQSNWNAYDDYTLEKVMNKFMKIFLDIDNSA